MFFVSVFLVSFLVKRGVFLVDFVGCSTVQASPILGPTASGWTSGTRPGGLVGGSTRGDHSTKATRHKSVLIF